MTFTHEQIRGAILRAAAHIESRPDLFAMGKCSAEAVRGSGGSACLLMHIGMAIGMSGDYSAFDVAKKCRISMPDINTCELFDFIESVGLSVWNDNATDAARGLRAFADHKFPAEVAQPIAEDRQLTTWDHCAWQPSSMKRLTHTVTHNVQPLQQPLRQQAGV